MPHSTTIDLQHALDRLAAGDATAKSDLVSRGLERLLIIARKLLRSFGGEARAELWSFDVLAEAYPRLDKALDDVKPTSVAQFLGLARLQMQRVLLDRVRSLEGRDGSRQRPQALARPNDSSEGGFDPPAADMDSRRRDLVIDLLETIEALPEPVAAVVWLRLEGHTFPEIGELLGVHKDTAERRWDTACVKLGHRLKPFMAAL